MAGNKLYTSKAMSEVKKVGDDFTADRKKAADAAGGASKAPMPNAPEADKGKMQSDARKALYKAHETERRDLHNSFRDQHRTMEARHDQALNALNDLHSTDMPAAGGAEPEAAVAAGAGE